MSNVLAFLIVLVVALAIRDFKKSPKPITWKTVVLWLIVIALLFLEK